jgi:hypothetical protein
MQHSTKAIVLRWFAIIAFLGVANGCANLLGLGTLPEGLPVFYWYFALYPNFAYFWIIVIPLTLVGLALLIPRRWQDLSVSAALLIGAGAFALLHLITLVAGGVEHMDSLKFKGHVYHLARESTFDSPIYELVLCRCDGLGSFCRCQRITNTILFTESHHLLVDTANNQIKVQIGDRTIYTYDILTGGK